MFDNFSSPLSFKNSSLATQDASNITNQDCPLAIDSTAEITVKVLAYCVILLVSLIGNVFLVVVIYKNKQLRHSINYFVFNMAVSDLFTPLTIMPVTIVQIISGSPSWKVDSPWILGSILCKLSYFLPDVSLVVSIENLVLIAMERFVAVVFPLKVKLISSRVRSSVIVCTWISAIAVHAPYFYTFRLFPYGNQMICRQSWAPAFNHVKAQRTYSTATFVIFIIVPICLLAIAYGTISWTLKRRIKKTKQELSCHQRNRDEQLRKIVRMSLAIIMAFVVCMIPMLVFIFILIFLWNWEVPPICVFHTVIPFMATFMLHSWSAVNPCICFVFNRKYRNGLKHMLYCSNDRFSPKTSDTEGNHQMQTKATFIRNSPRLPQRNQVELEILRIVQ